MLSGTFVAGTALTGIEALIYVVVVVGLILAGFTSTPRHAAGNS